MVIGAIQCPKELVKEISIRIRDIKNKHGIAKASEIKWTKISKNSKKLNLYKDLIDYFFDDDHLTFRAVVIDKNEVHLERTGLSRDDFYYRMYYVLLHQMLKSPSTYNAYIDIKDTIGNRKVATLHEVLCNASYDFKKEMLQKVQQIRSHESELMQLADLMIGAIGYANNHPDSIENTAKGDICSQLAYRLKSKGCFILQRSTPYTVSKFNLFHWTGGRRP